MALKTGPIPRVAFDQIIEEDYGDSVAQSLNNMSEMHDQVFWTPDTDYLAPTTYAAPPTDLAVWFTVGGSSPHTIWVPDWATRALTRVDLNGIRCQAIGEGTFDVQVQLGTVTSGRRVRRTGRQHDSYTNADEADWFGVSWTDNIDVTTIAGADRNVRILAGWYRNPGTDKRWIVDQWSDVAVSIIYTPAIKFYGDL